MRDLEGEIPSQSLLNLTDLILLQITSPFVRQERKNFTLVDNISMNGIP